MNSLNEDLYNAVAALAAAGDGLAAKREVTARARRSEAEALKVVNQRQAEFDALVAQVKKTAPSDSAWTQHMLLSRAPQC